MHFAYRNEGLGVERKKEREREREREREKEMQRKEEREKKIHTYIYIYIYRQNSPALRQEDWAFQLDASNVDDGNLRGAQGGAFP